MNLKIGLASSPTSNWVNRYLKYYEVKDYFDCIKTSDDVNKVKPNPELYLSVMRGLQVESKDSIIFEDSFNGLEAARLANTKCIVVPNKVTGSMDFRNADMILKSFECLSLKQLLKIVDLNEKPVKHKNNLEVT